MGTAPQRDHLAGRAPLHTGGGGGHWGFSILFEFLLLLPGWVPPLLLGLFPSRPLLGSTPLGAGPAQEGLGATAHQIGVVLCSPEGRPRFLVLVIVTFSSRGYERFGIKGPEPMVHRILRSGPLGLSWQKL